MSKHHNNKGFTLIEIIVTIVILAVLMAIATPSILKYIGETDDAKALTEAYACVSAAKYYGVRAYVNGTPSRLITSEQISKRASVNGEIITYQYDLDNNVMNLTYTSPQNIMVEYDGETYKIVKEVTYGRSVIPILQQLNQIAKSNPIYTNPYTGKQSTYNELIVSGDYLTATKLLQSTYKEQNGGGYEKLSDPEKKLLVSKGSTQAAVDSLYWKPMLDSLGNIIVVADASPNQSNSYSTMIYVNNAYYYHTNGYTSRPDAHSIAEGKLTYNPDGSPIPNESNPGKWILVDEL